MQLTDKIDTLKGIGPKKMDDIKAAIESMFSGEVIR